MTNWINTVNTTTLRIVASVCMAFLGTMIILAAIVFAGWEPKDSQLTVLFYLGMGVLAMMGIDLAQFATKRFTHAEYVAAKKGPSPVTVEAPSTVQVDAPSAAAPVIIDGTPVEKDD